MANLSSSHGQLTITHPDANILNDFIVSFLEPWSNETGRGGYGPFFSDIPQFNKKNSISIARMNFDGSGRWTFSSTLENLKNYMDRYLTKDQIIRFLTLITPIKLEWKYVDEECGCQVLYSATDTHSIGLCKVQYNHNCTNVYPYTLENLINLGFHKESYEDYFTEETN